MKRKAIKNQSMYEESNRKDYTNQSNRSKKLTKSKECLLKRSTKLINPKQDWFHKKKKVNTNH